MNVYIDQFACFDNVSRVIALLSLCFTSYCISNSFLIRWLSISSDPNMHWVLKSIGEELFALQNCFTAKYVLTSGTVNRNTCTHSGQQYDSKCLQWFGVHTKDCCCINNMAVAKMPLKWLGMSELLYMTCFHPSTCSKFLWILPYPIPILFLT